METGFCPECQVGNYTSNCICNLTQTPCFFVRRCSIEMRYLPLASMTTCKLRLEKEKIPEGYNKVRMIKNNTLFIEIDNYVIELSNPYNYEPKYVKVKNENNAWCIEIED